MRGWLQRACISAARTLQADCVASSEVNIPGIAGALAPGAETAPLASQLAAQLAAWLAVQPAVTAAPQSGLEFDLKLFKINH